jgi:hypothetical protein
MNFSTPLQADIKDASAKRISSSVVRLGVVECVLFIVW